MPGKLFSRPFPGQEKFGCTHVAPSGRKIKVAERLFFFMLDYPKADNATIARTITHLVEPESHCEIRYLKQEGDRQPMISALWSSNKERLIAEAQRLASREDVAGIYFTPNPLRPRSDLTRGATDKDVLRYRWLLIDIDPLRPSGTSATDDELKYALGKALAIRQRLGGLGFPEPLFAASGNGAHLMYRVNLPNDPESKELVKQILDRLANEFSDSKAHVDKSVSNQSRIWRLYGTVARKGENTADRPHRTSRIIECPNEFAVAETELLESFAGPSNAPRQDRQASPPPPHTERRTATETTFEGLKELHGNCSQIRNCYGNRNATLSQCAYHVYTFVAGGWIAEAKADMEIWAAAREMANPMDEGEIALVILGDGTKKGAKERGMANPRDPKGAYRAEGIDINGIYGPNFAPDYDSEHTDDAQDVPPDDGRPGESGEGAGFADDGHSDGEVNNGQTGGNRSEGGAGKAQSSEKQRYASMLPPLLFEMDPNPLDEIEKNAAIPVPWPLLNEQLGGGLPRGLNMLVGGTGSGKTTFAIQAAYHAAITNGIPTAYFLIEGESGEFVCRLGSVESEKPWSSVWKSKDLLLHSDFRTKTASMLKNKPIRLLKERPFIFTHKGIGEKIKLLREAHSDSTIPIFVIIDFLQVIGDPRGGKDNIRQTIQAAAYAAYDAAREYNACVLALSSTARNYYSTLNGTDKTKDGYWLSPTRNAPSQLIGCGKESGEIEYGASTVLVLCKDQHRMNVKNRPRRYVAVAKQRSGEPGWFEYDFKVNRFDEIERLKSGDSPADGESVRNGQSPSGKSNGNGKANLRDDQGREHVDVKC